MIKKFLCSMLLLLAGVSAGLAQEVADSLAQVSAALDKQLSICCLPVMEHLYNSYTGKFIYDKQNKPLEVGFCYEAKNGFVEARIADDELRKYANRHVSEYPVCQDNFCSYGNEFSPQIYYRADANGKPLQKGKFERDDVGFLSSSSAFTLRIPKQKYDRLRWTATTKPPMCKDMPVEELLPACVMKKQGPKKLAFVLSNSELQQELAAGNLDSYVAFTVNSLGKQIQDGIQLKDLASAGVLDQVEACSATVTNDSILTDMGNQVAPAPLLRE